MQINTRKKTLKRCFKNNQIQTEKKNLNEKQTTEKNSKTKFDL